MTGGAVVTSESSGRPPKPAPSADAPRGYTWDRSRKEWKPKEKGPILYGDASEYSAPNADYDSERDPEPAHLSAPDPKVRKPVSEDIKNDIGSFAAMVATPIMALLQNVDPICGGALAESFPNILDKTLPIICKSERVVKFFEGSADGWMQWAGLAMALAPVGNAILQHHVTRSIVAVQDPTTGQIHVMRRADAEAHQHGEALQPDPQPPFAYEA